MFRTVPGNLKVASEPVDSENVDAVEIITATGAPVDKPAVLASLGTLLESIDFEAGELEARNEQVSDLADQLASLESQRDEVRRFVSDHQENRPVSIILLDSYERLLDEVDLDIQTRNSRLLGLFRSAGACIMAADWPDDGESTTAWVESFNRIVDRRCRELRATELGYAKVAKIAYVQKLSIPAEIYQAPGFATAPKEYWLQYAGFSLVGEALGTRKHSVQLHDEMAAALSILEVATGYKTVGAIRPPGL